MITNGTQTLAQAQQASQATADSSFQTAARYMDQYRSDAGSTSIMHNSGAPVFDAQAGQQSQRDNLANAKFQQQAQLDPWSYYRAGSADKLSQFAGGEDPSNIFRDKLTQMSTGQFSPDDPSYKWRLDQGQQTVERSLGARGLLNSGNAAIELQQYGQGAASQEYGAQFGRMLQGLSGVESQYNTQFSRLASMAGITLDPSTGAKIDAGIQQAAIGASASVQSAAIGQSTGLARVGLDSQINQQNQNMYAAYDRGLGDTLSGRSWQNGSQ